MKRKDCKIVKAGKGLPEVLVYRDFSDEGNCIVIIQAFAYQGDSKVSDQIFEVVDFSDMVEEARGFIADFSKRSARHFCVIRDLKKAR